MQRRQFLFFSTLFAALGPLSLNLKAHDVQISVTLTPAEWLERLSAAQFNVLRNEDTEPPFSSSLNEEKRKGQYHCAGCDLPLFESESKYNSGTGWPSFYAPIKGHLATKSDHTRTEYHCARCGGHQGHVFKDGPKPTGLRWCNNGLALKFQPA